MRKHGISWFLIAGTIVSGPPSAILAQDFREAERSSAVEEIYVVRSVRESRIAPTAFCDHAKTGFDASFAEDQYEFRSTTTRAGDGRMIDTDANKIGRAHGCLGRTADPSVNAFYLEMALGSTQLKAVGDCRGAKSDFPEQGISEWHCYLQISDPAGRYVGGQLASNTVASRKPVGEESDPPGYTQPSIATIRLWKKR